MKMAIGIACFADLIGTKIVQNVMKNHSRDTDKVVEWNKTLLQSKLLKRINDDFSITYQVSH